MKILLITHISVRLLICLLILDHVKNKKKFNFFHYCLYCLGKK